MGLYYLRTIVAEVALEPHSEASNMMFSSELPSSDKDCGSKVGRKIAAVSAGNIIELNLQSKEQRIRGRSHEYTIRREMIFLTSHMLKTTDFIIELY